ncbi:MAG: endolytic transglycosylase MltG [Lachnospiraceae bacterium]|nr:endolytic transglycosylase MltG [Lachnospiraceae bacterium]MBR7020826.1 endolytic transglycosylase MltG [Lachnospiraceae bacterium]
MSKKKKKSKAGHYVISMSNDIIRLLIDILFYVLVAVAIIQLSRYAKSFCYQVFGNVQVDDYEHGVEKDILIELGDSTRDVGKRLEREGIIVNELSFYVKVKINKLNIMPGTYKLRTDMNYNEILDIIAVSTEVLEEQEEADDE